MPFSDYKTALVTGASSGMGAAIVERFRREGLEVHALARSGPALHELAARTGCIAQVMDVSDLAAITKLAQEVQFDILVNNAGVNQPGSILTAKASDIDLQMDVNLQAALHLVRLIMPGMVARDCGHIVNVSSYRRDLQLWRQHHLPRDQGGTSCAVTAAQGRCRWQAGARH